MEEKKTKRIENLKKERLEKFGIDNRTQHDYETAYRWKEKYVKKEITNRKEYLEEITEYEKKLADAVRQCDYWYCKVQKMRKTLNRMHRIYKKLLTIYGD